ncbi:anthranilate synthase component 1 [Alginatibacterium sediminis]|uniref:Anthranilate synthase component 1 n=1 Tax=Alginatibacterium sediminis TaxID=2164068 RepID=A0A420EI97_9ALTE|nr:anthranilate synthase component 1 [Alginatibacterium sediminis]RKF20400.1 anthranilate synthase component 1 [Alginatibacterium sediminis]
MQQKLIINNAVRSAPYLSDPLALYQQLHSHTQHSILLESAEINSKENLKSLMLIDAAVKISCSGREVEFSALSDNGLAFIEQIAPYFPAPLISQSTKQTLCLSYPHPDPSIDEDSRLKDSSPINALRRVIEVFGPHSQHPNGLFLGGVFAYDFIASFEHLEQVSDSTNSCPDYQYYVCESLLLIDHQQQQSELIGCCFGGSNEALSTMQTRLDELALLCENPSPLVTQIDSQQPPRLNVDISDEKFCQQVETLKDAIRRGDIFQVVPSRSFSIDCSDPIIAYHHLRITNPSPYMFFLRDPDFVLFGASPESSIKFTQDTKDVEIYPIAGTRPRGFNADGSINKDLDGRLELELRLDKKETAEHIMLVDLARNDVAKISEPGSRHVADLLQVDRYSHVMHLVSRVVGTLRADLDALHAYQACMNMGTLTGAPKIRATELIREIEGKRRGSYGGAVGYLNGHGDMDTCIVIRSAFVQNGVAHVQAGAGVVYDSIAQAEADETRSKAAAVLNAVALAHGSSLKEITRV